jgi:CDP-glycerol glycerophosphotransferase (TagB/SpsB family)
MNRFLNKKILIAPYSPLTQKFAKFLKTNLNIEIIGFIDLNKTGNNIYKADKIYELKTDAILIFSPNHFTPIYKNLQNYLSKKDIYKIDLINDKYILFDYYQLLYQNMKKYTLSIYNKTKKLFLKNLSLIIDKLKIRRELSVFIAEDFIDANIKHLFLYYIKNNKKAILLTNNKTQQQEFKKYNLPTATLFGWMGYFYTAIAKNIYLDHFILDYLEYTSPSQITIQLWHGVGLKPIQDRSKYHYNYFISTSDWTNESNFKKVFKADHFLNLGYPRNDILLKDTEDSLDLILCDMQIYNSIQENRKNGIKSILYMPTFRENGFENFPLNFKTLNNSMQELNIRFYVKLHPFVLKQYMESIKQEKYSNIIFYNTQGDIYPILKYVDILITDYSSIAYDFLFLNRPIIFFNYDYDEYIKYREDAIGNKFLFDYYSYTPGIKVQCQNQLVKEIKSIHMNNTDKQRERIKVKFFKNINKLVSPLIIHYKW